MKKTAIYLIMLTLLSSCASAQSFRHTAGVDGKCVSHKNTASLVADDPEREAVYMMQYERCLDRASQEVASAVNLCFAMYGIGGLFTFGLLWIVSPICWAAGTLG